MALELIVQRFDGLGECGKAKLYENYAMLEFRLGNVDRSRSIYQKMIERHPDSPQSWKLFVELELTLGENDRARQLCELGLQIEEMD